jgi:putative membrane protein insertion efficiency factor
MNNRDRTTSSIPQRLLLGGIRLYQWCLSPWLGHHCRFYPTCSSYAHEAIIEHGALRGTLLAGRRLLKCHPWHEGGPDPVPSRLTPHPD